MARYFKLERVCRKKKLIMIRFYNETEDWRNARTSGATWPQL
jgi:hypothetical protein